MTNNETKHIGAIKQSAIIGCLGGMLISFNLWWGEIFYPRFQFVGSFYSSVVDEFLLCLFFAALCAAFLNIKTKLFLTLAVVSGVALCFLDFSRLHPWFYQYLFMFFALGILNWGRDSEDKVELVRGMLGLIIAGIYFWSGISKINTTFVRQVYPWMMQPIWEIFPSIKYVTMHFVLLVPAIEMIIGLGLFSVKWQKFFSVNAILMHVFILISIGPLGNNWNASVWPWNLSMIAFNYFLFIKNNRIDFSTGKLSCEGCIVVICFWLLPALNILSLWSPYHAFSLYSGAIPSAELMIDKNNSGMLPEKLQAQLQQSEENPDEQILRFVDWSMAEVNSPEIPNTVMHKGAAKFLCDSVTLPDVLRFKFYPKPNWRKLGLQGEALRCKDLS